MKQTLLFIAPHLSTGGMPQYLYKQIETLYNDFHVYCIEWDNVTGGKLVIQRNRIEKLLGNKLITLHDDKHQLFSIIKDIKPDIIHLQEIPELFMQSDVADKLYATSRSYVLIETSHDSSYNPQNKRYLPDKFLMVSRYQTQEYKALGIPCDVVEYPIENKVRTKTREQALRDLGLDPNLKHVINVGLFTPRKNQAEVIEYARMLINYPIQFHFLGNQADNFQFYWEPLMKDFPSNCKWWDERDDVDAFYQAADLFLFTSRGHEHDKETMPLVIRESLSWKTPSLIYNLPVYMGYFDQYDTIEYLTQDIQKNAYRIAEKLLVDAPTNNSRIFYTINGEEKLTEVEYLNTVADNIIHNGEPAAQYFSTFILKELEVADFLTIDKGDVFVDFGANMGMSSIYAQTKGAAEIHCFEPDPKMLELVKKNIPTAHVYQKAVASVAGNVELYHWPYNEVNKGPTYNCEVITLQKALQLVGKKIDYLKIDIEGYENTLFDNVSYEELSQVRKMMIEVHDRNQLESIKDKLLKLGFDIPYVAYGMGQDWIYAKHVTVRAQVTNNEKVQTEQKNETDSMKEIYIISCYPNTEGKERYLNDTVKKLKSIGKTILLASHYPVPQYIVEKADYYIYDAYNMIDTVNHTLDTDGPDFWVETDSFRMDSIITHHASALSRMFGIAMEFAENRGYEYFVIIESDSDYDVNDLKRLDTFRDELIATNKDFLFFSPKFTEFAWQGERVYETYCYGGKLKPFLNHFKWPTNMEGWSAILKENKYNNCMEYLLKQKFKDVEHRALIKGTLKSEMLNSKVDLQTVGECSGVFYNETNPDQPILFLYNHDSLQRKTLYEVQINMNKFTTELNCNCWSLQHLNFNEGDMISVRINTVRGNEVYSEYVQTITRDSLQNLKKFKRMRFK